VPLFKNSNCFVLSRFHLLFLFFLYASQLGTPELTIRKTQPKRNRKKKKKKKKKKNSSQGTSERWVYPSEQMFYNAMRKKGWSVSPGDVPAAVAVHNLANERAWREIRRWEGACHPGCEPRLLRFQGRPSALSPKARVLSALGFRAPFDRHDWVVGRCGDEVRYVIDYYDSRGLDGLHLDVRPALDSPGALWDRVRMGVRDGVDRLLGRSAAREDKGKE
jgi:cytochrome c heme-lyase